MLILYACTNNSSKKDNNGAPIVSVPDTVEFTIEAAPEKEIFTIEAQFIEFSFGDAEHYVFKDASNKVWDFSSCYSKNFNFSRELNEEEANTENQGWGANEDLVGSWFKLTYFKTVQQLYIDGPDGTVEIIEEAIFLKKETVATNDKIQFKLNISELKGEVNGYIHNGKVSPDGSTELLLTDVDHDYFSIEIKSATNIYAIKDLHVSPSEFVWSASGEYVLIHEKDFYANDGTIKLTVINVLTGHYQRIPTGLLLGDVDAGLRNKFNIYHISWLGPNAFALKSSVGYLGYSGHPGIDFNREAKLGENFLNKTDTITLTSLQVDISTLGYASSSNKNKQKDYYICFNGNNNSMVIWIKFSEDGKALEVKHKGESEALPLAFRTAENITGGAYPTNDNYYYAIVNKETIGTYKITHSGNWDYVDYTREIDGKKLKFTIDHNANPYSKTPCFE